MAQTAADVLIETLRDWDVQVVFGLPGDGINGIMEALRTRQDRIRFVQVRHEESAAFMACGYAKFTGRLGVCLATSGPGGIHLLNGLYDAKLDGQPVLAITGLPYHDLIGTHTQQDVELDRVADLLAAPIVKALLGKGVVPDDSPYTTGAVGLLGTRPSQEALEACDTLLIVGTSFPYIEYYPKPGQANGVQIELDPMRIGLHHPVDVGLVGDSRRTLTALLPLLARNGDRAFLEKAQQGMKEWNALMDARAARRDVPMKPQVVAAELGRRLRDDAIVACDSGTITSWWAGHIPARRRQLHSVSGNLASMACGLPYVISAQFSYPG